MRQIPLPIRLSSQATFESYLSGTNASVVHFLKGLKGSSEDSQTFLWCRHPYGKSHLLQAICHHADSIEKKPAYIPLKKFLQFDPELLQGLDQLDYVCIDDIHLVVGDDHWESQLFQLINRCRESNAKLIFSSRTHPGELDITLADLSSRLLWGPVFHLKKLSDGDLLTAIMTKAKANGLELPPNVAQYILNYCRRDISELYQLIDRLDEETLIQKRNITLPLVKSILSGS